MREKPIIFSGPMVRAILDGRKTQTRRVIRLDEESILPAESGLPFVFDELMLVSKNFDNREPFDLRANFVREGTNHGTWDVCRYGIPGDRLWVRETWGLFDTQPSDGPARATIFYRSSESNQRFIDHQLWRPSIYMPRWASRLTLEVVSVRVERVQEIGYAGVMAEGCPQSEEDPPSGIDGDDGSWFGPGRWYRNLWDSINGKKPGCSWADNPWVWVVEFKRIEQGERDGGAK